MAATAPRPSAPNGAEKQAIVTACEAFIRTQMLRFEDCALIEGANQFSINRKPSLLVSGTPPGWLGATPREFGFRNVQIGKALLNVNRDHITFLNQSDRAAGGGFGGDFAKRNTDIGQPGK